MSRPFVLLDRDGTLIVERHYLADPAGVELLPGAAEGLRQMAAMGCGLILVTNQSGIGRGYFSAARLDAIHARLHELLAAEGVRLDGVYHCPHHPAQACRCRKPEPGMVEEAVEAFGFCPRESFVIGDKACDIDLGRRCGATTLLVRTGYGRQVHEAGEASPHHVVDDLSAAASLIKRHLAERAT